MLPPVLNRAAFFSAALVGVFAAADFMSHIVLSLKFGVPEIAEPTTLVLLLLSAGTAVAGIRGSTPPDAVLRIAAVVSGTTFMVAVCFVLALDAASILIVGVKPYGALLLAGLLSALVFAAQAKARRTAPQQPMMALAGTTCAAAVLVWTMGYLYLAAVLPA